MANEPIPTNTPMSNPELFEFFAFVVDGEVAVVIPTQKSIELMIAALSSDPKVVKLRTYEKNIISGGWTVADLDAPDNQPRFNPPAID